MKEIAREMGVTDQTLYNWYSYFEQRTDYRHLRCQR